MSYSAAYLIQARGLKHLAEFRNSWGFGPFVWSPVAEKYLGGSGGSWLSEDSKLWPLWKDMRLPRAWRASLLVTYDYAIIEKERFTEIGGYLRQFVTDVGLRERACHLLSIADLLDKHAKARSRGMCFYGNSIGDDLWHPWDYEKDKPLKYDFSGDGKHFYVGGALDESEAEAKRPAASAPEPTLSPPSALAEPPKP